MMNEYKILILDDDQRLCGLLKRYLTEQGFYVELLHNPKHLDKSLQRNNYHLLILDIMLPEEDGLSICKRLRVNHYEIPIIMLTAKGDTFDRILGLEIGADDYLSKPFEPRELLARMNALLRRVKQIPGSPRVDNTFIHFGIFRLDPVKRILLKQEKEITLTTGEFALLHVLVSHPQRPFTRDQLMNLARGKEYGGLERTIDVQISRLRKLIEENPAQPRYLQTVWGHGYVFVPDEN